MYATTPRLDIDPLGAIDKNRPLTIDGAWLFSSDCQAVVRLRWRLSITVGDPDAVVSWGHGRIRNPAVRSRPLDTPRQWIYRNPSLPTLVKGPVWTSSTSLALDSWW
jgi:hypothetical protein